MITIGPKKASFVFGDDATQYLSTTKEYFVYDAENAKPSFLAEDVKKGSYSRITCFRCQTLLVDLRQSHFHYGYEKLDYSTSSHIPELSGEDFKKYTHVEFPKHDPKKSSIVFSE